MVLEGQMRMFGYDEEDAQAEKADRYREKADEWVRDNHQAWLFICNEAVARAYQRRRFGIGELCEQVRWHMKAVGVDDFKINNSYRAYLARRLVKEHPQCADYIEMRRSRADKEGVCRTR